MSCKSSISVDVPFRRVLGLADVPSVGELLLLFELAFSLLLARVGMGSDV